MKGHSNLVSPQSDEGKFTIIASLCNVCLFSKFCGSAFW